MIQHVSPYTFQIVLVLFLFAFGFRSLEAQVVHKDDILNFIGVVTTTSLTEGPEGKQGIVKSEGFSEFHTDLPKNEFNELLYRDSRDSLLHQSVAYPQKRGKGFDIMVPKKNIRLVLLDNGGFEKSYYYLSLWHQKGDSLYFERIHRQPFRIEIGAVNLKNEYKLNRDGSLFFVLDHSGGDAGSVWGSYSFMYMDADQKMTRVLTKEYGTVDDPPGEKIILYDFLHNRRLVTNTVQFGITPQGRKIENSELELFDLDELIREKNISSDNN